MCENIIRNPARCGRIIRLYLAFSFWAFFILDERYISEVENTLFLLNESDCIEIVPRIRCNVGATETSEDKGGIQKKLISLIQELLQQRMIILKCDHSKMKVEKQ